MTIWNAARFVFRNYTQHHFQSSEQVKLRLPNCERTAYVLFPKDMVKSSLEMQFEKVMHAISLRLLALAFSWPTDGES